MGSYIIFGLIYHLWAIPWVQEPPTQPVPPQPCHMRPKMLYWKELEILIGVDGKEGRKHNFWENCKKIGFAFFPTNFTIHETAFVFWSWIEYLLWLRPCCESLLTSRTFFVRDLQSLYCQASCQLGAIESVAKSG